MTETPATRMELLRVKQRKKLAEKGHSLLKRKRDALIKEFFSRAQEYSSLREEIGGALSAGYDVLHVAQGVSGANRVKSLALATRPAFSLSVENRNLMGVRVPEIRIEKREGGVNASVIGTSYYVQEAYERFQALVPRLVKLAELEQVLLSLAEEIRSTKRRVNALEHIQIPRLTSEQRRITEVLAEQEREAFTRLKHVKKGLEG